MIPSRVNHLRSPVGFRRRMLVDIVLSKAVAFSLSPLGYPETRANEGFDHEKVTNVQLGNDIDKNQH